MEKWGYALSAVATETATQAESLSLGNLSGLPETIERPAAAVLAASIGVVHIGPGAFHRAHQAWYFDRACKTDPRWAISAVALKSSGVRDALQPQDGLYTVAVLDERVDFRVIGALRELLVASEDHARVLERMTARDTRVVTLTITEKGYCLKADGTLDFEHPDIAHDLLHPRSPVTAIGYLVEALRLRRGNGIAPFTTISCDNLVDNGHRLGAAVLALAARQDPALAQWIETNARFPRSMVDSIVPATDDALRARVTTALGVIDAWPVQRESFMQWVIENRFCNERPDFAALGVTITDDVPAFVQAKLRLLNGAHSSLAYLGLRAGHVSVADAMRDAALAHFVRSLMIDDILPSLKSPPGMDLRVYVDSILQRFRNPEIHHALAQIAWDGSQKLPFRLFGTVLDSLAAGRPIDRLCVPIAAWLRFLVDAASSGRKVVDPLADALMSIAADCDGTVADVARWLCVAEVLPQSLRDSGEFVHAIESAYTGMASV
jgi:fructuronate reductase